MREIIFRGKRLDNNDWIEGYPVLGESDGLWYIIPMNNSFENAKVVNDNTITQYTGLIDKHGQKIFENDIVEFTTVECEVIFNPFVIKNMSHKGYIFYQYGAFYVKVDDSEADYELHSLMDLDQNQSVVEVIGTVF